MKKFFDPFELAPSIADNLSNLESVAKEYEAITNNQGVFNIEHFRHEELHVIQDCAYGFRLAKEAYIGYITPSGGDISKRFKILELAALSAFRDPHAQGVLIDIAGEIGLLKRELAQFRNQINPL